MIIDAMHKLRRAIPGALMTLLAAACGDGTAPQGPDPEPDDERLIVSSTIVRGPRTVSYVSITPGAYLDGRAASITNRRTGEQRIEALVVGGLDPVALDADDGDTLDVEIDTGGGRRVRLTRAVPADRSLVVVRSEPAQGHSGVPVATRIVIVFSEPVDPSSVTGATRLLVGDDPVRGATAVSTDGLVASFTPSGDLLPDTEYTVLLGSEARGTDGAALDSTLTVRFRTSPVFPPPPGTFPPVPESGRLYLRTGPHTYPAGAISRYVLFQDGTFALQYVKQPEGFLEYTGRFERNGTSLALRFDVNAGQWQAEGTLDGESLAVVYNTDMALSDFEDGVYRLEPHEPWVPPESDMLAFGRGGDIYVIGDDGAGPRRLTSGEELDDGPAWSPDGERVAFTSTRFDGTPASETGIYLIARDGTGRVRLSAGGAGTHDAGPSWSPDGSRIAFHRKSGPEQGGDPYYQDKFEIYLMNADGSDPVRLTHHRSLSYGAAWSPDGSRIAYASWDYVGFEWTIRAMDPDGANDVVVTVGGMSRPSWSPDGTRLLFSGSECSGGAGTCEWGRSYLFTVDADGSNRRRVTAGAHQEWSPAWSPDGGIIALVAERTCGVSGCTSPLTLLRLADRTSRTLDGTLGAFGPAWRRVPRSDP